MYVMSCTGRKVYLSSEDKDLFPGGSNDDQCIVSWHVSFSVRVHLLCVPGRPSSKIPDS
jgi:hypothetical protein